MSPERWRELKELVGSALAVPAADREGFVRERTSRDPELGRQALSLLAADARAQGFLSAPAIEAAQLILDSVLDERPAPIPPGARFGPYEIVALIGAGGMGEVYRARDARLDRYVAIKILPSQLTQNPDRLRRFEQEARAAGGLNHPNILAIHDIGSREGAPYIVSELLEGETLRARLASGALSSRKAIDFAVQIARGLAAAHEKGIVHRDLKPENLFVTKDGRVKILDFGLAKVTRPENDVRHPSVIPTAPLGTEPGVVMGTVGYMSPEQVRGLPADARSDLFSLGAILYEMLSGKHAFRGDTPAETMAAILKEDPQELSVTGRNVAPGLDRIVRHCLEKSPEERFHSARDLAFDLEALSGSGERTAAGIVSAGRRSPRLRVPALVAIVIALVATGAVATLWIVSRTGLPGRREVRLPTFHQLTFRRGYVSSARFTPDGQAIVYGGAWSGEPIQLFSARADGIESTALPLPSADVLSVSSTGELALSLSRHFQLFFTSIGTLARAPLSGGAARSVLEGVQDADWSPDGKALAVVRRVGDVHRLEFPPGKILCTTSGWFSWPRFSSDGTRIAFFDHPTLGDDRGSVAVTDLNGKKVTLTGMWSSAQGLAWSPSGREIWFTASSAGIERVLYEVTLSGRRRDVLRAPGSLRLQDVSSQGRVLLARDTLRSRIMSLGPGEALERDLSWLDFSIAVDLSADGKTILSSEEGAGAGLDYDVYVRGTDGSPAIRLGEGMAQALSPDGKWALTLLPRPPQSLVLLSMGPGEPRRLKAGRITNFDYFPAWTPDSKRIVFAGREPGRGLRLFVQELGGEPRPITPEGIQPSEHGVLVSPDGKFATGTGSDGKTLLYPIDGGDPMRIPSVAAGDNPVGWGDDGRTIYVLARGTVPAQIDRVDLSSGTRSLWKQLAPADRTGLIGIQNIRVGLGGKAYAYSYWLLQSDLYAVEGLK